MFSTAGAKCAVLTLACAAALATIHPSCAVAAEYIGAELTDVKPDDKAVIAHPQPVQLLFQFTTENAPNGRATKYLKNQIFDLVKKSGFFSDVTETPSPNGALLSVTLNDSTNKGEDEAKGFATGATFFLVGSTVKDSYLCTVSYAAGPGAPTITKTAQQSLYTQIGLTAPAPRGAIKIGRLKDAQDMMIRQVVENPLNAIASDPGFQIATAPAVAAGSQASPSPEAVSGSSAGAGAAGVPTPAAPSTAIPAQPGGAAAPAQPDPTAQPAPTP